MDPYSDEVGQLAKIMVGPLRCVSDSNERFVANQRELGTRRTNREPAVHETLVVHRCRYRLGVRHSPQGYELAHHTGSQGIKIEVECSRRS